MSEKSTEVLLVIDVQRDFLPGGSLAVPQGDAVIPIINKLGQHFRDVVLTQDWHPMGHISFGSTHDLRPFVDTFPASYGTQTLWPDHTLQGSPGAELHPELSLPHANLIVRKGFRKGIDSYSAFLENDHWTSTGLAGYLRDRGLTAVFLCGLAWDYCVGYSALDGIELGFDVTVIEDAVRGIAPETMAAMSARWDEAGVKRIQSAALLG
jgi:nicotinamidase/pyrazinamidase